jgi:hypothetical protein
MLWIAGGMVSQVGTERYGYLKRLFSRAMMLKLNDPLMNKDGHNIFSEMMNGTAIAAAYPMSQMDFLKFNKLF